MALTFSNPGELGSNAPDFALPGVDGRTVHLSDFRDARALVIVFMCNHCPYVIATQGRINALAKTYGQKGVQVIGINSNDPDRYPDDNFEAMKIRAQQQGFVFPYLQDIHQEVAKAYGAVCTPEFFAFGHQSGAFVLKYKGRLDDNWKDEKAVTQKDLALALDSILEGRPPSQDQKPAMGCSIKWK